MGSMAEDVSDAAAAPQVEVAEPEQLDTWAREGDEMLNRYKLKEAEELFYKVLIHTDEKVRDRDKNVIMSLAGLSEIYSKRARSMRSNELEWHRMYMHAISAKRKALEYCTNGLRESQEDTPDGRWFTTQEHKTRAHLRVLQDCLVRSLQDRIVENKSGQTPMEKIMGIKKPKIKTDLDEQSQKSKPLVNVQWLETFQQYLSDKYATKLEPGEPDEEMFDDTASLKRSESIESLQEVNPTRKKKINFERVQAAIQDLVKQITTDMRTRQIHKDMTPEEKLTLMSPLADNFDLLGTFKKAMYADEPEPINEETEEEMKKDDDASSSSGTTLSEDMGAEARPPLLPKRDEPESGASEILHAAANWRQSQEQLNQYTTLTGSSARWKGQRSGSLDSADPHTQQTMSKVSSSAMYKKTSESPRTRTRYRSPTPTRTPLRSQRRHSLEEEDVLRDIGVLRVWRGYNRDSSPDRVIGPYKLESYEESSPLTDMAGRNWEAQRRRTSRDMEPTDLALTEGTPITESELNLTLAYALTNMADRLTRHQSPKEATGLFVYALGIFQKVAGDADSKSDEQSLRPHIAHIMQSLGSIKCSQGDFVGGSQLMEESISIFGMIKDREADLSTATTWYQLGSAFMAEQWKESTLYEYIMRAVKEVMEKEVKPETDPSEMPDVDADSDDEDDSEGDSYWVSTQEAIGCFNHALDILRKLNDADKGHHHLYVDVLTKLGDCNIMTGNYENAIKCYEEALYMFKSIIGSATLANNAHVLAMLGTTNFLCGNFSKAASMYECAHMLQQHVYGADESTFEMAFTLSMMGLTFYSMKRYHRSIAWCLKAFELYTLLYKDELMAIKDLQRWFVTESLYIVGYSYSTLSFHEKSLHYLGLSKCLVKNGQDIDVKQCVKILKAMADEYTSLEDNESALSLYNEALELSQALGNESSAAALQNQLLNRMAGVHVNTKEYSTAALYLQQALDYQKNVENSIKDDLVGILRQLGLTYTLSGDVDRAIECYNDCLDAYQEVPTSKKDEMAQLMGTLGTLYHVKACIQDDNEDMENLLTKAERFYQDAMNVDSSSSVCVQYANYLYQQAQAGDALLAMLPVVHSPSAQQQREEPSVTYNGVEHAVLPEHLQQEIDEMDEVTLETRVFSKFLAILCYKQLKLDKDAEDCLVDLFKAVCNSDVALNHSILGYAMLEMSLYPEAAECFANAAGLQHDNDLAITNYWISLCLWSYGTMTSSIRSIFSDALREAEDEWMLENKLRDAVRKANQKSTQGPQGVRDSGYYDHTVESGDDQTDEAWAPVEEITYLTDHLTEEDISWNNSDSRDPHKLLQRLKARHYQQESSVGSHAYGLSEESFMDRGYTSNECLVERPEERSVADRIEKWESIRNVYDNKETTSPEKISSWESEECETPAVILEMLKQQQDLLNREYQVHFDVGIIGEDEEEGDGQDARAETNSTFANMVETPQSILHELERKMVEEQMALEKVSQRLEQEGLNTTSMMEDYSTSEPTNTDDPPSDEWVTTEEVVYHDQPSATYSQQRKREHSPEPDSYEDNWVTEEVVVETPAAILQALHGAPGDTAVNTSKSSTRQIMPMELSPDTETAPETTETWTVEQRGMRRSAPTPTTTSHYSMSSADQQHVIDSIHNWDSEGNHVTHETYSHERPVVGGNNNYEPHHQVNGDRTQPSRYGSWRSETTQGHTQQPSQYETWRTETTHTKPVSYRSSEDETTGIRGHSKDHYSDGRNGNGWPSSKASLFSAASSRTTSAIHESYTPYQKEEPYEEVWESTEETVETPPEILALIRAQQMQ